MQAETEAAPADPSSSHSSSGHCCPHCGISAHPAKCNSCSGAFRMPPTQNRLQNSSNVTPRVQSVRGNGAARPQPFPGSPTLLPSSRMTEAKLPLPGFRAASSCSAPTTGT